jgi:hypothetical protein
VQVAQRGQLHPGSLSGLCRTVFSLAWVHGSLPCHQIPASSLQPQKAFCFAGPPGWGWSKRAPPSLFPATLLPHASLFRAPSVPSLLPCPWLLTTSDPYPVYCPLVHWPPCYCYLPAQSGEPPGSPCPGPPGRSPVSIAPTLRASEAAGQVQPHPVHSGGDCPSLSLPSSRCL